MSDLFASSGEIEVGCAVADVLEITGHCVLGDLGSRIHWYLCE